MKNFFIIVLFSLISAQATAATANWTGEQTMIQTITYRMAWRCTYHYAGRYFYQIFENSCPSQIQVY